MVVQFLALASLYPKLFALETSAGREPKAPKLIPLSK